MKMAAKATNLKQFFFFGEEIVEEEEPKVKCGKADNSTGKRPVSCLLREINI